MDNLEGALTPRVFTEGVESGYGGNRGAEVNVQGVEESKFAVTDVDVDVDVDGMEDDAGGGSGRCRGVERPARLGISSSARGVGVRRQDFSIVSSAQPRCPGTVDRGPGTGNGIGYGSAVCRQGGVEDQVLVSDVKLR